MKTPTSLAREIIQSEKLAASFLYKKFGFKFCPPFRGLIIRSNGETIGAAVFNNFHPGLSVDMTAAGVGAFGIREARALAYYVFGVLDCRRVTAITSEENKKAIRALWRIGFRQEGLMRQRFGDHDGLVFGLLRSEQRLIKL